MTTVEEIRLLVSKNKIREAISHLMNMVDDTSLRNEIIQQSAKYEQLEQIRRAGTQSAEEQNILSSRISESILQITDEISRGQVKLSNDKKNPNRRKKNSLYANRNILYVFAGSILIIIGIIFASTLAEPLQLTVYVHGPNGKQDIILQNEGKLIVDLGNDRRTAMIGENGRTNFGEIPENFSGKRIPILVNAKKYVPAFPDSQYVLTGNPIYYAVIKDKKFSRIEGSVKNQDGSINLEGVQVTVEGTTVKTDARGEFTIDLGTEKVKEVYVVTASKEGYQTETLSYYTGSTPLPIRLRKK